MKHYSYDNVVRGCETVKTTVTQHHTIIAFEIVEILFRLLMYNQWQNCWDLVLKWGGFKEQNDPHPSTISFKSAWGVYIWILGPKGLIDTEKFAQYLHELSRSHWEQNPAWCFSKSLLPSHSLSICATNSIMPVSRMVSLFSPVKNCSHWSDLALQLKVHYSKLIHTRLCKLFQCQDWIENNTRILVCCLKGKSFFTYM